MDAQVPQPPRTEQPMHPSPELLRRHRSAPEQTQIVVPLVMHPALLDRPPRLGLVRPVTARGAVRKSAAPQLMLVPLKPRKTSRWPALPSTCARMAPLLPLRRRVLGGAQCARRQWRLPAVVQALQLAPVPC